MNLCHKTFLNKETFFEVVDLYWNIVFSISLAISQCNVCANMFKFFIPLIFDGLFSSLCQQE